MAVAYETTADRPAWSSLPTRLRDAIADRLGGPVASVRIARSGFTRGFAGVVATRSGARAFVKASSIDYLVAAYRREAMITAALPVGVPAARPRWTLDVPPWYALGLDVIDGRLPVLPWRPAELGATLEAWAAASAALAGDSLVVDLSRFVDLVRSEFVLWQEIAAHRAPLPSMPRYALPHLDELASLEARLAGYAAASRGLMHGDLRLDNVLITPGGTARLCDWNHLCHGPAWFDTATLLVTAYASGLDADELFATHPTVTGRGGVAAAPDGETRADRPDATRDSRAQDGPAREGPARYGPARECPALDGPPLDGPALGRVRRIMVLVR